MRNLVEVYDHNYRLQEGPIGAAVGIAAAAGGWKLGQAYGAGVGASIGRTVGERVGHAVGKATGPLLGALVVGSIAHKLYYALLNKNGHEPTKRELQLELQRQLLENQLAIERNRNSQAGFTAQGTRTNMALADLNDKIQRQLDDIGSIRESEDEDRFHEGILSRLAMGGLKIGGKVAAGAGRAAVGAVGKGLKHVGQAAAQDAKALGKWGVQKASGAAQATSNALGSAARTAMNPSQTLGNKLATHANPKIAALGKTLSTETQGKAMDTITKAQPKLTWMANNGQATLGDKGKAFGKLVAGNAADTALQSAAISGGAYALNKARQSQQRAPQAQPQVATQQPEVDSTGATRPGPDYVMVFGKWRKRLSGDSGQTGH